MKRIVTYDVKVGNSYDEFYELADEYKALMLTESTYLFDTNWDQQTFENKVATTFNRGDNVHYVSVNDKGVLFTKKLKI